MARQKITRQDASEKRVRAARARRQYRYSDLPNYVDPAREFVRLAELNVGRAIKAISRVAALGRRTYLARTDGQVKRILGALTDAVARVHTAFTEPAAKTAIFSLNGADDDGGAEGTV